MTGCYFAGDGREWPLGNIQMVGKSNWAAMKGEEPKLTRLAPRLSLEEVARHAVDFWLTTEDVPKPDNRVTVDRDGNVHLAYRQTNAAEADGLYHEPGGPRGSGVAGARVRRARRAPGGAR